MTHLQPSTDPGYAIARDLAIGELGGSIFDFPKAGMIVPMHKHDQAGVHITICARGSVRVRGEAWELVLKPGEICDSEVGQYHSFEALEDDSRIISIRKFPSLGGHQDH